jgi:hypothetical protein
LFSTQKEALVVQLDVKGVMDKDALLTLPSKTLNRIRKKLAVLKNAKIFFGVDLDVAGLRARYKIHRAEFKALRKIKCNEGEL